MIITRMSDEEKKITEQSNKEGNNESKQEAVGEGEGGEENKKEINEEGKKTPFNPYIPDKENPYNNLNNIMPPSEKEFTPDDHVLICYECKSSIKINLNWKFTECPQCHKVNRIPHDKIQALYLDEKLSNVRYNSYKNHLDTILPVAFIIITCPYCKYQNKVVNHKLKWSCCVCERMFTVDYTDDKDMQKNSEKCSLNPNSKYYKYNGQKAINRCYPPINSVKISDYFFPDPINYDNDYYYNNGHYDHLSLHKQFQYNNNHQLMYTPPPYASVYYNNRVGIEQRNANLDNAIKTKELRKDLSGVMDIYKQRETQKASLLKDLFFLK